MIPIFHRCDYELHTAMKLKVKVLLSPHIADGAVRYGWLYKDVCISNIDTAIDSERAICSWQPDKESIHAAIKSESPKGFEDINSSVEKIRLDYLLDYPVEKIKRSWNEETREYDDGRYAIETYIVPSIITVINRIHSIHADEIPNYEEYGTTLSDSSDPKAVFRQWTEVVKFLINNKSPPNKNDFISYIKNCCQGNNTNE